MNKLYLSDIGFCCSFKVKNQNNNILEKYKFEISENVDLSLIWHDRENDYLFLSLTLDEKFNNIRIYIINNFLENNRKIFYKKFNQDNYQRVTKSNINNINGYITYMDMYIELTDEELFYIKLKYDISLNN